MSTGVTEHSWTVVVPHHASAARFARHRLAAVLQGLVPADLLADSVAVVAELVGNAVRHANPLPGGVVRVAWHLGPGGLEIRVTDGGAPSPPVARDAGTDAVDGRGLAIVAALALRWGVERDSAGQCVWAALGHTASNGSSGLRVE